MIDKPTPQEMLPILTRDLQQVIRPMPSGCVLDAFRMADEIMARIEADRVINGTALRALIERWGATKIGAGIIVGDMILRIEADGAIHRDALLEVARRWGAV